MSTNIISLLFFNHVQPLIKRAQKNTLHAQDFGEAQNQEEVEETIQRLQDTLDKGEHLWRAVAKAVFPRYYRTCVLGLMESAMKVTGALVLKELIREVGNIQSQDKLHGYLWALFLSLVVLANVFCRHHMFFQAWLIGIRIRSALTIMVYRKLHHLSSCAIGDLPSILNLISVDAGKIEDGFQYYFFLITAPVEITLVSCNLGFSGTPHHTDPHLVFMYNLVGWPGLVGMAFQLLLMPYQVWSAFMFGVYRKLILKHRDKILSKISDVVNNVIVVKSYNLAAVFTQHVIDARTKEVALRKITFVLLSLQTAVAASQQYAAVLVIIGIMWWRDQNFGAAEVYGLLSLLSVLTMNLSVFVARAFEMLSLSKISLGRIEKVLTSTTMPRKSHDAPAEIRKLHISFEKASFSWSTAQEAKHSSKQEGSFVVDVVTGDSKPLILKNVTCNIPSSKNTVIIGAVGSGKSSLLHSIMGEIPLISGKMTVQPNLADVDIAYAPQVPFVLNVSVKDNVTFGREWSETRWNLAIKASGLASDLPELPGGKGMDTIVGENGKMLSGGQRARLGLARALYVPSSIYLLDNVLSAVDMSVAQRIYQDITQGRATGLIPPESTLIIATNQLMFATKCDHLIVLDKGCVIASGDPESILRSEPADKSSPQLPAIQQSFLQFCRSQLSSNSPIWASEDQETQFDESLKEKSLQVSHGRDTTQAVDTFSMQDSEAVGQISASVYSGYLTAGLRAFAASAVLLALIVLLLGAEAIGIEQQNCLRNVAKMENGARRQSMIIFSSLVGANFVIYFARVFAFYCFTLSASNGLFRRMFSSVINAHSYWFDQVNPGGILNRFTKDLTNTDESLPVAAFDSIVSLISIIGIFVVLSREQPLALIAVPFLVGSFVWIRQYYMHAGRQFRRVDSAAKTPIYALLSSTIQGLTSIRSFADNSRWLNLFERRQLNEQHIFTYLVSGTRWLALRLDLMAWVFLTVISFFVLIVKDKGGNTDLAAQLGMILSAVKGLIGLLQWCVRQSIELETQMISVERIIEYTDLPPDQSDKHIAGETKPSADWPQRGDIRITNMNLTYPNAKQATLKNMTLHIPGRQTTAIIGPSGSGKSSLTAAILRLYDYTPPGCIEIDGRVITDLTIQEMRNHLCLMPQTAGIFDGTVRFNLDAQGAHTDAELWEQIDKVGLRHRLESHVFQGEDPLQQSVGSSNWSAGEIQLICMVRALLRNTAVYFLDEPTSSIDPRVDDMLQHNLRHLFGNNTVCTVAHRLTTILDYDNIIVIIDGRVAEQGNLSELMNLEDGWLKNVVSSTDSLCRTVESHLAKKKR